MPLGTVAKAPIYRGMLALCLLVLTLSFGDPISHHSACLSSFLRAAITKYHTLGAFDSRSLLSHSSGRSCKCRIQVLADVVSPEVPGLLSAPSRGHSSVCTSLASLGVSKFPLFVKTPVRLN